MVEVLFPLQEPVRIPSRHWIHEMVVASCSRELGLTGSRFHFQSMICGKTKTGVKRKRTAESPSTKKTQNTKTFFSQEIAKLFLCCLVQCFIVLLVTTQDVSSLTELRKSFLFPFWQATEKIPVAVFAQQGNSNHQQKHTSTFVVVNKSWHHEACNSSVSYSSWSQQMFCLWAKCFVFFWRNMQSGAFVMNAFSSVLVPVAWFL